MGLEFLARMRRSSLWVAVVAGLAATSYRGLLDGSALAAGCVWSVINLLLLEKVITALTGPDRGSLPALKRIALALAGMLPLFAVGGALVLRLPVAWLTAGFVAPFAVMLLKATSTVMLGSRAWRWMTASPWRAGMIVAALIVAAWWILPGRVASQVAGHAAATASVASPEAHAAEPAHAEAESGPAEFPNLIGVIARTNPNAGWSHFLHHYEVLFYSLFVAFALCFVCFLASRNPQMIPGPLQNLVEMLVEGLRNFIASIMGDKHAARFVPFLGTLGLYIWCMNLFGLIPFMHSATSNLNVTFALGLTVFVYVQYIGIRELGIVGYVDHLLGQPRDVTGWILAPLMLPIHLLGELAKPISLSCRLFGNIFGEDMLLVGFATLGVGLLSKTPIPIGVPFHLPFLLLALLGSTLQAAVFMILTTIYIFLMLPHEHHEHETQAHEATVQHSHP